MAKHKFLAFDIETAKLLPDEVGDLMSHRPLGITCAATLAADESDARRFYTKNADGTPASQMSRDDLSGFVDHLVAAVDSGYTIVTLNGLGFDFDILAEESGRIEECKRLAVEHVDMMFQIFCERGFPVGLNAAAQALGLSKPQDTDGAVAPQLWADGEHDRVLDYVAGDCRLTMEVASHAEESGRFVWITKRGKRSSHGLSAGWLRAVDAMKLPLPDTSWMDNPWPRDKFTGWLES